MRERETERKRQRQRYGSGATWNHKQSNATIRGGPLAKKCNTYHGQKGSPTSHDYQLQQQQQHQQQQQPQTTSTTATVSAATTTTMVLTKAAPGHVLLLLRLVTPSVLDSANGSLSQQQHSSPSLVYSLCTSLSLFLSPLYTHIVSCSDTNCDYGPLLGLPWLDLTWPTA